MARYRIDSERSSVVIEASSTLHPIHSRASGLEGWLDLDVQEGGRVNPSGEAKAHLELPVAQLRSGNPLEERELKRRVDTRRFPTIDGDLTSIEGSADNGRYRVRGDVTFRGVSRSCEDEVTIEVDGDDTVRLQGSSEFDVRDFGMEPPRILLVRVHPEVKVAVDIVAVEKADRMCLGIPGQIVDFLESNEHLAKVDVSGVGRIINIGLLEDDHLAKGDWVLIHVGFAMSKIDEHEAARALEGLLMMGAAYDDELAALEASRIVAEREASRRESSPEGIPS